MRFDQDAHRTFVGVLGLPMLPASKSGILNNIRSGSDLFRCPWLEDASLWKEDQEKGCASHTLK